MKKKIISSIIVLGAIVAFIVYTFVIVLKKEPLVIQGQVAARQYNVASKIPGRIQEIAVQRGQMVKTGDFIFSIDSPEIDAKLAEATAAKSAAEAQSRKAKNGAQPEDVTAAYSVYVKAEAAAQFGQKTFSRVQRLFDEGVVPEQQRDEAETKMKAAQESARAAKAIWEKARKGAREEDKAAAQAMVERADAAIEQVKAYLNETTISAIADGEVSGINVEKGELVPTGFPVVTILDLNDTWVTLFLREDLMPRFAMGNTFTASVPALANQEFEFKVSYVSATADFARWNATKTSGEFDLLSFEVEARPTKKIQGLRPGMTIVVTIPELN